MRAAMQGADGIFHISGAFPAESLRVIAGATYIGDHTKALRELGLTHRPIRESWVETLEHELKDLGDSSE